MKIAGFDWDAGNWPKCGKHGVSQESIEQVFGAARLAPDVRDGRLLIRPLSARYMHAREASRYEESSSIRI